MASREAIPLIVAAYLGILVPRAVSAHGEAASLANWGGFSPEVAACQRTLGRAAATCAAAVWDAQARCHAADIDGLPCDRLATERRIHQARVAAVDLVETRCTPTKLQALGYADLADATSDVIGICRRLETSVSSLAFAPLERNAQGGAPLEPNTAACVRNTAAVSGKLLRLSLRARQRALDRIAAATLSLPHKRALLDHALQRTERAKARLTQRLGRACSTGFSALYSREAADLLTTLAAQADCAAEAVYVQDAVRCPPAVCGNGIKEAGEECDDGNRPGDDTCDGNCRATACAVYASTFELIQHAIFENRGCTNDACHGAARQGALDLRAGTSYEQLIDVPATSSGLKRVEPGDQERSLLWLRLAKATLGRNDVPGSPMPLGLSPLSIDELEALRLWIYHGAPRNGTAPGTDRLLNACLPAPEPIDIVPLPPPAPGTGVQIQMPPWVLAPHREREVCFASYFDLTDQVPFAARSDDGLSFCFESVSLRQNPLSHHLTAQMYYGASAPDAPEWGPWSCRDGSRADAPCSPLDAAACGTDASCGTGIADLGSCVGFGPADAGSGRSLTPVFTALETAASRSLPAGVYSCLPLKGVMKWNTHAFNLTDEPADIRGWLNFDFADAAERRHEVHVDINWLGALKINMAPFTARETCDVHVLPPGARVFELTPHTHKRGKRFQIFRGDFRCRGGARNAESCSPLTADFCRGGTCAGADDADTAARLLYTNFRYSDAAPGRFDPPLVFEGPDTERTLTFCALYDNGLSDPSSVKRLSQTPHSPLAQRCTPTHCAAGKVGTVCSGAGAEQRHRSCDTGLGSNDGACDACRLQYGLTTEDEMFVLTVSFYVP